MEDWTELPPRRVVHRLRAVREEVHDSARRRRCDACGELRLCAKLNLLAPEEGAEWFCLTSCWTYQMGVTHGHQRAARLLRALADRALERV